VIYDVNGIKSASYSCPAHTLRHHEASGKSYAECAVTCKKISSAAFSGTWLTLCLVPPTDREGQKEKRSQMPSKGSISD